MKGTKLWWALLAVGVVAPGCGGAEEGAQAEVPFEDALGETDDELSTKKPSFVAVRRDVRKCAYPFCGGYWVRDLNAQMPEQYVYALNFTATGLDQATRNEVASHLDQVLLKGRLSKATGQGVRRFIVHEVYRGMPGITPEPDAAFYSVSERLIQCVGAPCDVYQATRLNTKKDASTHFAEVDVAMSLRAFVDAAWLTRRVVTGRALVAGKWLEKAYDWVDGPGAPIKTLDASQVYVRLPDDAGPCPMVKLAPCPQELVRAYSRTEDRCVVPSFCTEPTFCTRALPVCDEGYTLVSWSGEGGCEQYACDPGFVGPQVGGTVHTQAAAN